MVQSLKKTPYRPKMAILGSRDRMCIHSDLRPRNKVDGEDGKWNVNTTQLNMQCRIKVSNTERVSKCRLMISKRRRTKMK